MSASLNQTLSSNYHRNANIASKRQRPPSDNDEQAVVPSTAAGTVSGGAITPIPAQPIATTAAATDVNSSSSTASSASTGTTAAAAAKLPHSTKKLRGSGPPNREQQTNSKNNNVEGEITDAILAAVAKKQSPNEFLQPRPTARLADLAGIDAITAQVTELVFYPVRYPSLYNYLGVQPPCGLLLNGPSGCGKTFLASAIAGELGLPFFKASGPELIGGTSGESEGRIRDIFQLARENRPSVLFIDGLDVIAGKRDGAQRGMDRRIVAQLFDCIDAVIDMPNATAASSSSSSSYSNANNISESAGGDEMMHDGSTVSNSFRSSHHNGSSSSSSSTSSGNGSNGGGIADDADAANPGFVILIAATNKADALDPGVRGRFSRELSLPVPDAPSRTKILTLMTNNMRLAADVDLVELGRITPGFVGSDLKALAREAGMLAVSRIIKDKDSNSLIQPHLLPQQQQQQQQQQQGAHDTATTMMISDTDLDSSPYKPLTEGTHSRSHMLTNSNVPSSSSSSSWSSPSSSSSPAVHMIDFVIAAKSVQPSAKREGFAVVPDVTWSDVGALAEIREELLHNVLEPIAHPERFRSLGLEVPAGEYYLTRLNYYLTCAYIKFNCDEWCWPENLVTHVITQHYHTPHHHTFLPTLQHRCAVFRPPRMRQDASRQGSGQPKRG